MKTRMQIIKETLNNVLKEMGPIGMGAKPLPSPLRPAKELVAEPLAKLSPEAQARARSQGYGGDEAAKRATRQGYGAESPEANARVQDARNWAALRRKIDNTAAGISARLNNPRT